MESRFSQAALTIIGISVFNYDFKALTSAAPVIQATYTALKEVETRSMDLLPTWRLPEQFLRVVSPRQKSAQDAVTVIREVTTKLVDDCKVGTSRKRSPRYLPLDKPSLFKRKY